MNNSPPQDPQESSKHEYSDYIDDGVVTYEDNIITRNRVFAALAIVGAVAIVAVANHKMNKKSSVNSAETEKAKTEKKEMMGGESTLLGKYGGELYSLKRLPGMTDGYAKPKGNVYVRIPEDGETSRLVIYLHGNGDQSLKDPGSTGNMMECVKKLNLPLIAPQDGNGKWKDFNNTHFLSTLVSFAESQTGETESEIDLASFSGGNVAVVNILKNLENSKDSSAQGLYHRIKRIVFFDSADGKEAPYVARWMSANSDGRVYSHFNEPIGGIRGFFRRGGKVYNAGNNLLLSALEAIKIPESRVQIDMIPKKQTIGHGVRPDKCEEYLK